MLFRSGFCRISAVTAHQLSFDTVPAGWAADAGTGIALRVFAGDFLVNGTTIRSNTIERQYLDHAPVDYEYFTGQALNVLAFDAKQAAPATYTKTYVGKSASITPVRAAGATDIPGVGIWRAQHHIQCRSHRFQRIGRHGA